MKLDWWLVLPMVLLSGLSLVILRSVAPQLWLTQASFVAISAIVFLVFSLTDYKILSSLYIFVYVVCLLFLISPLAFGNHSRGALRWIQFGQTFVQPSEIIKPFLLLVFAYISCLGIRYKWIFLLLTFLLPVSIIFIQPDLGTSLVLFAGWFGIFIKSFPYRSILILSFLFLPLSWFFLHDYQRDRLLTFLSPYRDPLGKGYHVIQSTIAVGSGQVIGRGLGQGTQSQLRFLPERHTDFIYASLAEELGFVGTILSLGLLNILLGRVYFLSTQMSDEIAILYCRTVVCMLGFQIFVNVGMNMGLAPVTGITLPFLSYGGSSLLSLAILFGIINSMPPSKFTSSSL